MKPKILLTSIGFVLMSIVAGAQTAPPSSPAKRSAAELEKLAAPIALYSDPLIATILPASVYPLEIVQAARFVADTNNIAKLDSQPWDDNVKAVASVPAVIKKMNDDLQWTVALGEAFLAQDKELADTIQSLRTKAIKSGVLKKSPQQTVVVTNMVVEKVVETKVVVVTNTVVQIQPVNSSVVYVPAYNPVYVYAPPPNYVYNPMAPLVTFGVGVVVGAAIVNNCDWHHGGVYVGHHGAVVWHGGGNHYHGDVDIDIDRNVNVNNGNRNQRPKNTPKKWQPNQNRLKTAGTPGSSGSARTREARGWSSGGTTRPSTTPTAGSRPASSTGRVATRPTTGNATTRPATGNASKRPSTGNVSAKPKTATRPSTTSTASRPSSSSSRSRSSATRSTASRSSAFSRSSGSRSYSSRGYSSRSSSRGRRGGGRSGGGRR